MLGLSWRYWVWMLAALVVYNILRAQLCWDVSGWANVVIAMCIGAMAMAVGDKEGER